MTMSTPEADTGLPVLVEEALDRLVSALPELQRLKEEDMSETDTRSKLIDFLLKDILQWKEDNITREESVATGYYDYRISIPGFSFIVEAKRNFQPIKLPSTQKAIQLRFIATQNSDIWKQIQRYCVDTGVPYGVVTNGHQFFIGQFINTAGGDWRKNSCLVFDGFDDIRSRFLEFYTNLSLPGIAHHGGFQYQQRKEGHIGQRILTTLVDGEIEINRNNLSGKMSSVVDRLFGEMFSDQIEDDTDFIRQCFVENEETKRNRDEIDMLFEDSPPALSNIVPAKHTSSIRSQISYEIRQDERLTKSYPPPKPIVAIGSRGAGKTTFINHLFRYKFAQDKSEAFPWIYIDFRKYQDRPGEFQHNAIADDIIQAIHEKYESYNLHSYKVLLKIYERELRLKNEGGWSELKDKFPNEHFKKVMSFLDEMQADRLSHLEKISKHLLKDRRKRLIVIIDNTDQFSDTIQGQVFLFAHALNRTAQCGVVISLREGYYYKWRNSPPFDAYESNVYHISAPPYAQVLQKRLDYAIALVKPKALTNSVLEDGKNISIKNESILNFLKEVRLSIFTETNSAIVDFLKYTTHTNIREGLRVFRIFLTSGHTNVADLILESTTSGKPIVVPKTIKFFQFLRAIGLQNKVYYNHSLSVVPNLFFPSEGGDSHFLKYYLLKHLSLRLVEEGVVNKYQQYTQILAYFSSLGFKQYAVRQEVIELLKLGMIDSQESITDTHWSSISDKVSVSISSKGHYYLNSVISTFVYLDLVLQDTPIFDTNVFVKLRSTFPHATDGTGRRDIERRMACVKHFVEYLKKREADLPPGLIKKYGTLTSHLNSGELQEDYRKIQGKLDERPFQSFRSRRS